MLSDAFDLDDRIASGGSADAEASTAAVLPRRHFESATGQRRLAPPPQHGDHVVRDRTRDQPVPLLGEMAEIKVDRLRDAVEDARQITESVTSAQFPRSPDRLVRQ